MPSLSKKVSMKAVKRLPRYYRYLDDLHQNDIKRISSQKLANLMGVNASQIRQDLRGWGQEYGYNVVELNKGLKERLGLNNHYNCIIIGAGNMGQAIANYERFKREGVIIKGMFDSDCQKNKTFVGGVEVKDISEIEDFVKECKIDICILCVPHESGQKVATRIANLGIKGILNFSPVDLIVPSEIVVENVNILESLFTLTYLLRNAKLAKTEEIKQPVE